MRIIWQTVGRTTDEILGVKGLRIIDKSYVVKFFWFAIQSHLYFTP